MTICAYCGQDRKATREHLIPDWYLQIDRSPDDVTFLERAKKRFIDSDPVIKDVCGPCNNGPLSSLDGFGRNLYATTLSNYLYGNSSQQLEVDFTLLVKWLLKIAFNSARVNNTDLEILADYAPILISEQPLPLHLHVFVGSVAPSSENTLGESSIALPDSNDVAHYPSWFRIGVFRVSDFDSISWAYRHITINSYCFYLLVPKLNDGNAVREEEALLKAMQLSKHFGAPLTRGGVCDVPAPQIDSLTYSLAHIGSFPFSYNIVQNDMLKNAIDGDFGLIQYWIDRADIESGRESNLLSFLSDISSSREIALGLRGKVDLLVHGYDEDARELYEIPEVVAFFEKIDRAWPYWMLFQFPHGHWLRILAICLARGKRSENDRVEFESQKMKQIVDRWFLALNELSHRYAISTAINKDASEKAIKAIFGSN